MQIILITYINRSGSTFLANMLSSSGDICVCPEGDALVKLFLEAPGKKFTPGIRTIKKFRKSLALDRKMEAWSVRDDVHGYLEKAESNIEAFRAVLKYYLDFNKPAAKAVVFKAERISALMNKIMLADRARDGGEIKFLSIVRDPRAVVASQLNTNIPGSSVPMSRNPVWTAIHWRSSLQSILKYGSDHTLQKIIKYEDLIAHTEDNIKGLSEFLGIDLSGISAGGGDLLSRLPEEARGIHPLAGESPQMGRIDAWKSRLTADRIYHVEKTCSPYLSRFGYERLSNRPRPLLDLIRIFHTSLFSARRLYLKMLFYLTFQHHDASI